MQSDPFSRGVHYALVVKRDCPTCTLIEPIIESLDGQLKNTGATLRVFTQDDPTFPDSNVTVVDDRELKTSFELDIESVPTLVKLESGVEQGRAIGWHQQDWATLTGIASVGENLPAWQAGCGALNVEPGMIEELSVRYGRYSPLARRLEVSFPKDPIEACYDRGWSDGLPVTPPTPARVLRMLAGTKRQPDDIIGEIPPAMVPCTLEKVAINAVMAGCLPEYMPVVLAALKAVLDPKFSLHGVLCTTDFVGPIVIVNGPIAKRIGMNSGVNVLGQGSRANATIGRAIQLIVRNVGGGRPGEIDRSTLGQPGKFGLCYAEDESDKRWQTLAQERGINKDASAVTVFAGAGVQGIWEERARSAQELANSIAMAASAIGHPKRYGQFDANIVIAQDHYKIFADAGWDRQAIKNAIEAATARNAKELERGVDGVAEGLLPDTATGTITKFRPGGLLLTRAGGPAGLISAVISGWAASGERGSTPVTREIVE